MDADDHAADHAGPAVQRPRRASHQHEPDTELLRECGLDVQLLDSGCCGLAGNFGFERGHYDVSAACAERGLWPAARDADQDTVMLTDGFSCRTQLAAGRTGREGWHLAQLLERVTRSQVAHGTR